MQDPEQGASTVAATPLASGASFRHPSPRQGPSILKPTRSPRGLRPTPSHGPPLGAPHARHHKQS
eukprot:scaffold4518_cov410-Prasinococcus_capsulatus_cf.AAC.9